MLDKLKGRKVDVYMSYGEDEEKFNGKVVEVSDDFIKLEKKGALSSTKINILNVKKITYIEFVKES